MRPIVLVLVAIHAALSATAVAQRGGEPAAAGPLQGLVLTAGDAPAPVRGARIARQSTGGSVDVAYSDDRGRFLFPSPLPGDSIITVSKPGYAAQRLQHDSRSAADLVVALERGAAIIATIVDTNGDPAAGVGIRLERTGVPELAAAERYYLTDTDDRGEARIGSLPAGHYRLTITDSLAAARTDIAVPQAASAAAVPGPPFELRAGEETALTGVFHPDPRLSGLPGRVGPSGAAVADTDAIVRGRVVSATGRPMPGATVLAINVAIGSVRQWTTDASGAYEVPGVAPGLVRISVRLFGPAGLALEPFLATNVTLEPREERRLDFVLPRGGVAEGMVVDASGEPVEGAAVQLWRARTRGTRTVVERASEVLARRTDDLGRFRLYGIMPGSYYVVASEDVFTGDVLVNGPVVRRAFLPDATGVAGALPVPIGADQMLSGLAIAFPSVPLARVNGRITDSAGEPFRGSVALAPSSRSGIVEAEARRAQVTDGTFTFPGVPPGDYVVKATGATARDALIREPGNDPREFAVSFLTVAGNDVPVVMQSGTGSSIRGRIVVDGDRSGRGVPDITIEAIAADPDLAPESPRRSTTPAADGTFELRNLSGAVRIVVSGTPPGWWVEGVTIDGIDASIEPVTVGRPDQSRTGVEVLLSTAGAEISGAIRDFPRTGSGAVVLAYPTESRRWFERSPSLRLAPADRDGRFALDGLPPGEYLVVAVDASDINPLSDEWQNPDLLSALAPRAQRVTVRQGARVTAEIRLTERSG